LGVTGICLGSAFLKKLYVEGGHSLVVKQVHEFVRMVDGGKNNP